MGSFFRVKTRTRICDLRIKKTTGDPVSLGVKDIGYADIFMIAFYFFDRAGKDPWMAPQRWEPRDPFSDRSAAWKELEPIGIRHSQETFWAVPQGKWLCLSFRMKAAAFAAAFLDQPDFADRHLAIDGFTHIVNCQPSHACRSHGFHLDAGLAIDAHGRFDFDARWIFLRI